MTFFRISRKIILFFIWTLLTVITSCVFVIIASPFGFRRKILSYYGVGWTKMLALSFGVKVKAFGKPKGLSHGLFFVSNHLSYLDIAVLFSKMPVVFVSKAEVRKWPVLGWMASYAGTIYVQREDTKHTSGYVKLVKSVLNKNISIILFPEGTSSDGTGILPYKTSLFQAPIDAEAEIMPIYIEYKYINGKKADTSELRDKVCWYGDMDFGSHIIELLKLKKIEVHVYFGEKIKTDTTGNRSIARKAVCAKAYLQTEKLKRTSASEN